MRALCLSSQVPFPLSWAFPKIIFLIGTFSFPTSSARDCALRHLFEKNPWCFKFRTIFAGVETVFHSIFFQTSPTFTLIRYCPWRVVPAYHEVSWQIATFYRCKWPKCFTAGCTIIVPFLSAGLSVVYERLRWIKARKWSPKAGPAVKRIVRLFLKFVN